MTEQQQAIESLHAEAVAQVQWPELGMSLRDFFSAKAMQACIEAAAGWGPLDFGRDMDVEKVAEFAGRQADAMLAERAKGGTS